MSSMRVVFLGTPEFAVPCLEMLIAEDYVIEAVITQPDRPKGRGQKLTGSPVKELAVKHGLPVWQPEKIKDEQIVRRLADLNPDCIIVVAFGQLLSQEILDIPKLGCINVHASLLPQYRGAAPIHWAVINGDAKTGVTTMFMERGLDTGDMILKDEITISSQDTTGDVHDKLKVVGAKVLSETLKLAAADRITRCKQDDTLATYAVKLTRELELINWKDKAHTIHNLVRGLNPWPGAYALSDGKTLKIWRTRVVDHDCSGEQAGTLVALSADGFIVATGKGRLEILEVQPENKKRMGAREYAHGYRLKVGESFI